MKDNGFKKWKELGVVTSLIESLPKNQLEVLRKSISHWINLNFQAKHTYKIPIDERVFTLKELIKFIDAVKNPKYKMLFKLQSLTGLRIGELCQLVENDFDLSNCFIRFQPSKQMTYQKFYVKRFFPKWLAEELKYYIKYFARDGLLFPNTYKQYKKEFRIACKKLGKPFTNYYVISKNGHKLHNYTSHSLRKFYSTYIDNHTGLGALAINDTEKVALKHYISKKEVIQNLLNKIKQF